MDDKPFEVYVSYEPLAKMIADHDYPERNMRFNARFGDKVRAQDEVAWYKKHGYHAEIALHGVFLDDDVPVDDDDDYCEGANEWPEGSGG